MPGFTEALKQEFENLQRNRPYITYGTGAKAAAQQLMQQGKRHLGKNWENLRELFTPDEARLLLDDPEFAKEMLKAYDPSFAHKVPSSQDIRQFRDTINKSFPDLYNKWNPMEDIPPEQSKIIREGATEKRNENLKSLKQAESMMSQASRIAPLNPLHETAKQMLVANNPTKTIDLGRNEIAAASRTNIPHEIKSYLDQASQNPAAFLQQYEVDYRPVLDKFAAEARRNFFKQDMPNINNQFASHGAFHSSARQAALQKAMADREKMITQEAAKLAFHGREEAMKHFNEQRAGHHKAAELTTNAHQAKQHGHLAAADALRVNAAHEQTALQQHAGQLSHLGNVEQRQAQNELDVRMQEHEREMNRPYEQLAQKAAMMHGFPIPQQNQLSPALMNPSPPNPLSMGAGFLGQMAGMMMQPQQQHHAEGGLVRRGYATGDSVAKAAQQLQQMRNGIQDTPEEVEMRESAQNFKNYNANPWADFLFTTGSHILANPGQQPMQAFGEGSLHGMDAFKKAQGANLNARERYSNLMDKINQTKMNQQQFIAQYGLNADQREEMARHHKAMEAESKRAHDIMSSHYNSQNELASSKQIAPKLSITERKLESDAKKDLLRSIRMKKEVGHLGELIKKTSSGPVIGGLKIIAPETKIDNQIRVKTNKLILDMHQGMKNIPRSEEFMKRIESTKPNRSNYQESNEEALNMMNEGANDVMEHSISALLSAGWNPEKIEKQFNIKVPQHFLEGEAEEAEPLQTEDNGEMVSMIDPNGGHLSVPAAEVNEALRLGATYG